MQAPGEALILRLWDTLVVQGIGSLLRPSLIRREGRARTDVRVDELMRVGAAELELERMRQTALPRLPFATSGRLSEPRAADLHLAPVAPASPQAEPRPGVPETVLALTIADATRREINIARATISAEDALSDDTEAPPSELVDADWLTRWRDAAGGVSSEGLQLLWGRILAGEVKAPGSYSLRAIDFLRNITQAEACAIEEASTMVLSKFIIRTSMDADMRQPPLETLLRLHEIGWLSGVEGGGLRYELTTDRDADSFAHVLRGMGHGLWITHPNPTRRLSVHAYLLTNVAVELLPLTRHGDDLAHLRRVARSICQDGFGVQIITDLSSQTGSGLTFKVESDICTPHGHDLARKSSVPTSRH